MRRMVAVLLLSAVGMAEAQTVPVAAGNTDSTMRAYLTALLGIPALSSEFRMSTIRLASFPALTVFVGELPAAHNSVDEAIMTNVPGLGLLALGSAAAGRAVASRVTSPLRTSNPVQYARDLAVISGEIPSDVQIARELPELPQWARRTANAQSITLRASSVTPGSDGGQIVTLVVWSKAVWEVTVILSPEGGRDVVMPARLLIGNPSG